MERSPELEQYLRSLYELPADQKASSMHDIWSQHPDTLGIGTSPDEFFDAAALRDIPEVQAEELDAVTLRDLDLRAWVEGDIGWAVAIVDWDYPDRRVRTRDTTVLRREDGRWRMILSHSSIGVSNQYQLGVDLTTWVDRIAAELEAEPHDLPARARASRVAIAFTDIEDSTSLTERLGDREWVHILGIHDAHVRRAVARERGFVVKHQGDGFMLVFDSAAEALRAAIGVQEAMSDLRADGSPIRIRAGVHVGEPIRHAHDFFGRDVVLAARITARAAGGQILLSRRAREQVSDSDSLAFRDLGSLTLKGIEESIDVFELEIPKAL
ncbi:MAG TPA: adenylate/guanylate cyclase domain-containing protein [Mycobacteriales bacterium]|nr:adenylate/guanylate cyclase domain-containing protein [Mycobacteriales bacterium]